MWAAGFRQFHKGAQVDISAAGSEDALKQIVSNRKVVAMLSRPVKDQEIDKLKEAGVAQPVRFVVAREALGVWVHASNPITAISFEQLQAIFTKEGSPQMPTWGSLGVTGPLASKPVKIVLRPETSGTHAFLKEFVFANATMREGSQIQQSNAEVLGAVSKDPDSITVCGLRATGSTVRSVPLVAGGKPIPSDDHAVLSGQYPFTRHLTLILDMSQKDSDAKACQEFVHFALCQAAQLDAIKAGFFPAELPKLRAGLDQLQGNQLR
jgi:phosphate transport system substrate-binding protein